MNYEVPVKGVTRGKGEIPPTERIVVENGAISEGSILSNKFPKNKIKNKIKNKNKIKIQFFYTFLIKIFQNFLKIS